MNPNSQSSALKTVSNHVWIAEQPLKVLGMQFGARMTVLKLKSGDLVVVSPIRMSDSVMFEIDQLGPVKYVIAPCPFHHIYLKSFLQSFPKADLYGPATLVSKRADLHFQLIQNDEESYPWSAEIKHTVVRLSPTLSEVVFFHEPSQTMIATDLLFNLVGPFRGLEKLFAWVFGLDKGLTVSRISKWMLKDRPSLREAVSLFQKWQPERLIVAHGEIILKGANQSIQKAFSWL